MEQLLLHPSVGWTDEEKTEFEDRAREPSQTEMQKEKH